MLNSCQELHLTKLGNPKHLLIPIVGGKCLGVGPEMEKEMI